MHYPRYQDLMIQIANDDDCHLVSYTWRQEEKDYQAFLMSDIPPDLALGFERILTAAGYRITGIKDMEFFPFAQDIISISK